jgi:hypothetical protein
MTLNKITKLGFYLLFIMSIITIILIQNSDNIYNPNIDKKTEDSIEKKIKTSKTIEVFSKNKKPENIEIISSKKVGKTDSDNIVVKDSNGDLYILNKGKVIAGNLLLIKDNENKIFIQRLNEKEKIVYN